MVRSGALSRRHFRAAALQNLLLLKDAAYLRDRLGIKLAFLEDPMLEGMLAARYTKGVRAAINGQLVDKLKAEASSRQVLVGAKGRTTDAEARPASFGHPSARGGASLGYHRQAQGQDPSDLGRGESRCRQLRQLLPWGPRRHLRQIYQYLGENPNNDLNNEPCKPRWASARQGQWRWGPRRPRF